MFWLTFETKEIFFGFVSVFRIDIETARTNSFVSKGTETVKPTKNILKNIKLKLLKIVDNYVAYSLV